MLSLRPYQNQAADFLYEHDRAMVLAPVGAGKTALTLVAIRDMIRDDHAKRVLVIAPKRVCLSVWPVECQKWTPELTLSVAVGTPKQRKAALEAKTDIVVSNYDTLQWLSTEKLDFSIIVFDELTRLKNPSGARFKALAKVIDKIPIRWGLTGSFTSNGLEDVFGQCKIIDQRLLGRSKGAFLQQYFFCLNQEYGQWEPRNGALEQVMQRIKPATFVLEPSDYKDKLPPLHVVEVKCDMDMADYNTMKRDFVVQFPDTQAIAVNAAVVTSKLQQMASGFVYGDKTKWISHHKFDRLDELLDENQHANTIIVYTFTEELAELRRRLPHVVTLDDGKDVIDRWNDGKIRLLAVHPKSAQFGLNLQHGGNMMVFLSLPWSLTDYEQVIGRLHRSGQTRPVWVYVMLTNKTVDNRIFQSLQDKRSVADVAMEELRCS